MTIARPEESDDDKWICSLQVKTSSNEYKTITSLIPTHENSDDFGKFDLLASKLDYLDLKYGSQSLQHQYIANR